MNHVEAEHQIVESTLAPNIQDEALKIDVPPVKKIRIDSSCIETRLSKNSSASDDINSLVFEKESAFDIDLLEYNKQQLARALDLVKDLYADVSLSRYQITLAKKFVDNQPVARTRNFKLKKQIKIEDLNNYEEFKDISPVPACEEVKLLSEANYDGTRYKKNIHFLKNFCIKDAQSSANEMLINSFGPEEWITPFVTTEGKGSMHPRNLPAMIKTKFADCVFAALSLKTNRFKKPLTKDFKHIFEASLKVMKNRRKRLESSGKIQIIDKDQEEDNNIDELNNETEDQNEDEINIIHETSSRIESVSYIETLDIGKLISQSARGRVIIDGYKELKHFPNGDKDRRFISKLVAQAALGVDEKILPFLLPPHGRANIKNKTTVVDVEESIILFARPVIVIIGKDWEEINDILCFITEKVKWKADNMISAIDIIFKSFWVLDLAYPYESEVHWGIIQKFIYNIESKVHPEAVDVMINLSVIADKVEEADDNIIENIDMIDTIQNDDEDELDEELMDDDNNNEQITGINKKNFIHQNKILKLTAKKRTKNNENNNYDDADDDYNRLTENNIENYTHPNKKIKVTTQISKPIKNNENDDVDDDNIKQITNNNKKNNFNPNDKKKLKHLQLKPTKNNENDDVNDEQMTNNNKENSIHPNENIKESSQILK
ncbi:hypothetical protein HCN44_000844 [Aphidius gifuensis]|uniref:Uncharacterized protein n=1 Tax=Aphidius gifuensis TaxID=684658 RepID=A0A835CPU6_APHGI|nr:hypothetical protein HCN44_000844 [Aphidius gifuensis]